MSPTSSARMLSVLTWLVAASLVCAAFAPVSALAQPDQPSGPTALVDPAAAPERAPDAGLVAPTSTTEMILLPWSDTSIRIAPPQQALGTSAADVASATFQINYLPAGATQSGFTCLTWPTAAQTAFSYAASIWGSLVTSTVPIKINACWTDMGSTSILGSSGSYLAANFSGAPQASTWYAYSLADKFAGTDLAPSSPDSYINYNSTFSWYFGTDGNTPANQIDFASVVMHEMGHSLNFFGSMKYGASYCSVANYGCWGYTGYPYPVIYDRFAENGAGQSLIDTSVFPNGSVALGTQLTGGSLYFDGPNANAANGGNRVKLYAPSTWSQGSSYSHLDYSTFASTAHKLMVYAIPWGASIHDPGAVTMGLLKDLGWTTAAPVPTISINDVSVIEGNSGTTPASFTVSLATSPSSAVAVNWATLDGSAAAGSDYVAGSGTISFAIGEQSKTVSVMVNGDGTYEGNETFNVNLSSAMNATIADGQGVGTIVNDDAVPACHTLTTSVSPSSGGSVSAKPAPDCNNGTQYSAGTSVQLTSAANSGYTFANWTGDATGTASQVTVTMDANKSATANFTPTPTCFTLTTAVSPTGGGSVSASPAPNCNGTQYSSGTSVQLTAAANSGYTFAGWSGDASGLTTPTSITMSANKSVTANFQQVAVPLISINDASMLEGNKGTKGLVFTISLSAAAPSQVTVNWVTANGTATGTGKAADYVASSGTATIPIGSTSATITVQVKGDRTREFNENFTVNLSIPSGATISDSQGQGTIVNDD